ncbi:MAG: hypothetical protein MR488_06155 [Lachnospiraceae bacterium]|nr:hypothetical protein [Lachnospiraceae bacterium]
MKRAEPVSARDCHSRVLVRSGQSRDLCTVGTADICAKWTEPAGLGRPKEVCTAGKGMRQRDSRYSRKRHAAARQSVKGLTAEA